MTLPRSHALAGRPAHIPHAVPPDAWRKAEGRSTVNHVAGAAASPLASDPGRGGDPGRGADSGREGGSGREGDSGRRADSGRGPDPGRSTDPGAPHAERVWEQRRALGRRLASLRSRSGFSQWEFAPLTGYSRSTLSDAELGRHRLRREFWQRCDEALMSDDVLTAAYDRIEALAMAVRRTARSQAQAAREEQASRRLQALLPAPSAEDLGAEGAGPILPVPAGTAPATVPGEVAPDGVAPDEVAPGGGGPGGDVVAPGRTTASGIVWGGADPVGPLGLAPAALRVAPDSCAPAGSARVAGLGRAGSVPPDPASSGATAHPETATQPHREGTQPHGEGGQSLGGGSQPHGGSAQPYGGGAQPSQTVMEQCPHCHQPVTVIIVAGAPLTSP